MKRFILFLGTLLLVGCGDGPSDFATDAQRSTVALNLPIVIAERTFHDSPRSLQEGEVVALILEAGSEDHEGDLSPAGVDKFQVTYPRTTTREFRLPQSAKAVEVRLRPVGGADLIILTDASRLQSLEIPAGDYELEFRNLSAEPMLVFVQSENEVLRKDGTGLDLSGLDFSGVDIAGRNFSNCNLSRASLMFANCRGVNFSGSDLRNALLSNADCNQANFSGANLGGAHFLGTNVNGTNLAQVRTQTVVGTPAGVQFDGPVFEPPVFPTGIQAAERIEVTPDNPLVISDGPTVINVNQLRIRPGGQIIIETAASFAISQLIVDDPAQAILIRGRKGDDGGPGTNGINGGTGGEGEDGKDGVGSPDVTMSINSLSQFVNVQTQSGDGGTGGRGGQGGNSNGSAGGDGGKGGNGGNGGSGGKLCIISDANLSLFSISSEDGQGGSGGLGGLGGAGTPPGQAGTNGNVGTNGQPGVRVVRSPRAPSNNLN